MEGGLFCRWNDSIQIAKINLHYTFIDNWTLELIKVFKAWSARGVWSMEFSGGGFIFLLNRFNPNSKIHLHYTVIDNWTLELIKVFKARNSRGVWGMVFSGGGFYFVVGPIKFNFGPESITVLIEMEIFMIIEYVKNEFKWI